MSSEIKIVEAPDCTCIRCDATAPLRPRSIVPTGTNVDGFRALDAKGVAWCVAVAERPEGWIAGPNTRDLRSGLCTDCAAAWKAVSREFAPKAELPVAPEPEPPPAPSPQPSAPPPAPGRRFFHASIAPQVRATPIMASPPRVLTPPPQPIANQVWHQAGAVAPTPSGAPAPIVGSTIAQRVTVQPIRHDRIGVVSVAPRVIPPSETAKVVASTIPVHAAPSPTRVIVERRGDHLRDDVKQVAPAPSPVK